MGELIEATGRGRRLKSLDEFEAPAFVGRMDRVEKRRRLLWYAAIAMAVCLGAVIGLVLF
jgi:type IV secretory pathway component VirB8